MKQQRRTLAAASIITLLALASIAWISAALLALTPIFARILGDPRFQFSGLDAASEWLLGEYRVVLISGLLLVAGFLLTYSARRLILRQRQWRSDAGCPHCAELDLVRVHRQRLDRFLGSLLSLPLGRYLCRECRWRGLRLIGYNVPPLQTAHPTGGSNFAPGSTSSISSLAITATEALDAPTAWDRELGFKPVRHTSSAAAVPMPAAKPMPAAELELTVDRTAPPVPWADTLLDYATRPFFVAMAYLVALTAAEIISVLVAPTIGVTAHIIILFLLLMHAALVWDKPIHRFLLALTLVPLIRVISLSLPLVDFPLTYWFFITSVPLFAAAYMIMRQLDFNWRDLGLQRRSLPLQVLIGLSGILLGITEYLILEPEPLVESFSWQQILLPAAILFISTGFLEEYVFRFLMQRTSVERLGRLIGIVYVGLFFAVLHIGYRSVSDFLFVLLVGLFFGLIAWRTRSIVGVTISHGLTNIMLFLIVPFIMLGSAGSPLDNAKDLFAESVRALPGVTAPSPSALMPDALKIRVEEDVAVESSAPATVQQARPAETDQIQSSDSTDGSEEAAAPGFIIIDYASEK